MIDTRYRFVKGVPIGNFRRKRSGYRKTDVVDHEGVRGRWGQPSHYLQLDGGRESGICAYRGRFGPHLRRFAVAQPTGGFGDPDDAALSRDRSWSWAALPAAFRTTAASLWTQSRF